MTSFVRRRIDVTFQLGTGAFGESGTDTVKLSGLRCSAHIVKAGGTSMGMVSLRVFGMSLSLMNQLTALSTQVMMDRKNTLLIEAGDDQSGIAPVFIGTLTQGWGDLQGSPEAFYECTALAGYFDAVKPIPPSSFPVGADAAVVLSGLATLAGLKFENSGVSVQLSSPYFPGTVRQQIARCADAANIAWTIDDDVLAIWPRGSSRGGKIPLVSPDTGLASYPSFTGQGISVTTLFNPSISFGGRVKIDSRLLNSITIEQAEPGVWFVSTLMHDLESEMPGGAWFTRFEGYPLYGNAPAK